ncbi:MAG: TonB-dependent receptor, partial [Gammaproteobacteria bacterium]
TLKDGGSYDVSVSAGRNEIEYRIANTVNASYGPDSPTEFDLGGQVEFENLINLDFTHPVPVGLASDLNIAYGLQYHQEHFQMIAGQTESWEAGGFESQGALIGANGFQGFSSDFSGKFERDSFAVYTDLEIDVTDHWLTGMAFRLEKFSDFGSTFDGKLSNRYKFTDQFSLRSTISTGFRAPSIGQSNLQRAATSYDNGQLTSSLTVPPTEGAVSILSNNDIINNFNQTQGLSGDAAVVALDAKPLDPEKSINASLGTIFKWDTYKLSVDYYRIQVDGRISLRSNIPLSDNQRTILENAGVKGSSELFSLAFFTNSLDSTTEGLDVMFSNELNYGSAGQGLLSLYANYNSTKIDDYIDSFVQTGEGQPLSDERKANLITEIERGVPDFRANVSYLHSYRHFDGLVRVNYYSETFELLLNEQCCAIKTD